MGSVPAQQAHNFSPAFAKPRVGRSVQLQQDRNSHRVPQKPDKMTVKVDPTLGRSAKNFRSSAIIVKNKCTQLLEAMNRENQSSKLTKKKKKKLNRIQKMKQEKESKTPNAAVNSMEVDSTKDAGSSIISEIESVEKAENLVLRKLLRGPRYFDSPGSSWQTCNKCGDDDHKTADCNMKRREKPCYICGGFEHNPKHCKQERNGSLNNSIGRLAKGCLEKDLMNVEDDKLCLRCGNSGHEMFSCSNDYSPDDLKVIRCYICNKLGHLCCAEYTNERSGRVSCYKCGRSGHLGPVCPKRGKRKRGYNNASICQTL